MTPLPTSGPGLPLANLLWRYCTQYVNAHDFDACDDVIVPDYRLLRGDAELVGRDGGYKPEAQRECRNTPDLELLVRRVVTDGERIAMHFVEHGASVRHERRGSTWDGVGLYRWDGERLTECRVEEDYYSRREQLAGGEPNPLGALAPAPWAVDAVPADPGAVDAVRRWVAGDPLAPGGPVALDDVAHRGHRQPRLVDGEVVAFDAFAAGGAVAVWARFEGEYRGGLPGVDDEVARGRRVVDSLSGIVDVADGEVRGGAAVTDRIGVLRALRPPR
ncbi:MAG: nuclear transport factor 2 family protein [Acidimicrobiia bacterium]